MLSKGPVHGWDFTFGNALVTLRWSSEWRIFAGCKKSWNCVQETAKSTSYLSTFIPLRDGSVSTNASSLTTREGKAKCEFLPIFSRSFTVTFSYTLRERRSEWASLWHSWQSTNCDKSRNMINQPLGDGLSEVFPGLAYSQESLYGCGRFLFWERSLMQKKNLLWH